MIIDHSQQGEWAWMITLSKWSLWSLSDSKESEIEWKFQSEGGDIGFGVQKKLARCFLSRFLIVIILMMISLGRWDGKLLTPRFAPAAHSSEGTWSNISPKAEMTKSLWMWKVSRNRKTDKIGDTEKRFYRFSCFKTLSLFRGFCCFSCFQTLLDSGPLWAGSLWFKNVSRNRRKYKYGAKRPGLKAVRMPWW